MSEFAQLSALATEQKSDVLAGVYGGYELHTHNLYRDVLPGLIKRHGAQKGRNMITLLAFLHAYKVGEPSASSLPGDLRGWAIVSNRFISENTGMKEATLIDVKKALVDERLLIIRKRAYKGNEKDYYLPLYFPRESDAVVSEPSSEVDGMLALL